MAPPPDHHSTVGLLRRFVALRQGGRPIPADVAEDVFRLVEDSVLAASSGNPAAIQSVFARPAIWRASRRTDRDRALAGLWALARGGQRQRAYKVEEWIDDWQDLCHLPMSGADARHKSDKIPPAAVPFLELLDTSDRPLRWRAIIAAVSRSEAGDTLGFSRRGNVAPNVANGG